MSDSCSESVIKALPKTLKDLYKEEEKLVLKALEVFDNKTVREMEETLQNIASANRNPKDFRREAMKYLDSMKRDRVKARLDQVQNKMTVMKHAQKINDPAFKLKDGKINYEEIAYQSLVGTNLNAEGANHSVSHVMVANESRYMNAIENTFDEAELNILSEGKDGASALEIQKQVGEIIEIGTKEASNKYPRQLIKIAEKVKKLNDFLYKEKIRAGFDLGYEANYILRSYDATKISKNYDEALAMLHEFIDKEASFAGKTNTQIDKILRDSLDGIIEGDLTKGLMDMDILEKSGRSSLEARMTKSRKFVFKKGTTAQWNEAFGRGTLMENMIAQFKTAAKQNALREVLGPAPKKNFEKILSDLIRHADSAGDKDAVLRLKSLYTGKSELSDPSWKELFKSFKMQPTLDHIWANLDGRASRAGNKTVAWVFGNLRSYMYMTTLGKSTITATTDLANMAAGLSASTGQTMLDSWQSTMKEAMQAYPSFLKAWASGNVTPEMRSVFETLNIHMEVGMGAMFKDLGVDNAASKGMASLMNFFTRVNPIGLQAAYHKAALLSSFSDYMGRAVKSGNIDGIFKNTLKKAGFTEEYFDVLTDLVGDLKGDIKVFGADNVADIPASKLETLRQSLAKKDPKYFNMSHERLRKDIARKIDVMFIDIADNGVPTPSLKQQSALNRGTAGGTLEGELVRTLGMLKSFALKMNDSIGRVYHANGGNLTGVKAVSAYMAGLTGMGYVALSLGDASQNKTPRSLDNPDVWLESFMKGGSAGLYGDLTAQFLTNQHNNFAMSIAGPLVGTIDKVSGLATKTKQSAFNLITGDKKKKGLGKKDINTAIGMLPFNNHVVLRPMLDAIFLDDFMNANDPKRKRYIKKRMKEYGQKPIFD